MVDGLLEVASYPCGPSNHPYGMKQLYAIHPDGYELCFQWPAEQTERR